MVSTPSHARIETMLLPVTIYHTATIIPQEAIQAGGTGGQTEIIEIGGFSLAEIQVPSGWTTAGITFLTPGNAAQDISTNWQSLYHADGTEYVVTAAAGINNMIPLLDFEPFDKIKIRSGTKASPVQQSADAVLVLRLMRQLV